MRVIFCLWAVFYSLSANAASLTLPEYLRSFLTLNEEVKTADIDFKKSEQDLRIAKDLYQTDLLIAPSLTHQEQKFSPSNVEIYKRNPQITGALTQTFATGTELKLEATKTHDEGRDITGRLDSDVLISLSQPLLQNSFGGLSRLKIEQARFESERLQSIKNETLLKQCIVGTELYINTYILQEISKILDDLLDSARKLNQSSDREYRSRLTKKIDWLSARADYLDIQSKRLESEQQFESFRGELFIRIENTGAEVPPLNDPSEIFKKMPEVAKWNQNTNPSLQALAKELSRNEKAIEIARKLDGSEVDFKIQAGQKRGTTLADTGLEKYEDRFLGVALEWTWPVYNQSLAADLAKTNLDRERVLLAQAARRKQLQNNWFSFLKAQQINQQRLTASLEKVELYRQQMNESNRMVQAGKHEVERYLEFRDRYLNEKVSQLNMAKEIWIAQLRISELNGQIPPFCEVAL